MSDEGRNAFQIQQRQALYEKRRGQVLGLIPVEDRKRWELAGMCSGGC